MKVAIMHIANGLLALAYAPLKLLPTDESKIVFLSRQFSVPSLDFIMLRDELVNERSGVKTVFICNRIQPGLKSKLSYMRDTLRSLYHLATSSVCVLDSYWPAVSVLSHKPQLTVIQMWHALGKVKQSGLQAVGKPGGRDEAVARVMRMHANYDYVIAGAPIWNKCYCACFGCDEGSLLNYGLPRMDYLVGSMKEAAVEVKERYPQIEGKKVVLYAPTFRRAGRKEHTDLAEAFEAEDCVLIVKAHPNQEIEVPGALRCPEFTGMQLLSVADLVITDYSAIALEAATAGARTLYYLYDYERYRKNAGLNIDIPAEMPDCTFYDLPSLMEGVRAALAGAYPDEQLERYKSKFLISDRGHSTRDIAQFVLAHMDVTVREACLVPEGGCA